MESGGTHKSADGAEQLKREIRQYHREEVLKLIKQGALSALPEDERTEVCRQLMGLRDIRIVDAMWKVNGELEPELLNMDFGIFQNRQFVRETLGKYRRKLSLSEPETAGSIFETACRADDAKTVKYILEQKKPIENYTALGEASLPVFQMLQAADIGRIPEDKRAELYYRALTSDEALRKLEFLQSGQYDIQVKNKDGMTPAMLIEERLRKNNYAKNKKGQLSRTQDERVLQMLTKRDTKDIPQTGNAARKRWAVGIAAFAVVCVCVGVGAYVYSRQNTADAAADASVQDAAASGTEASLQESYGQEEAAEYRTDTSLTVASGDTVNIDYTGYIDDEAFDGGSTNGAGTSLVIGSGTYIDDFEEQLIGHNVGEEVTVNVTFPENYGNEELNGKDARFEVTINGIYE